MIPIKQAYSSWKRRRQAARHLHISFDMVDHLNCDAGKLRSPDILDLATVAFNNPMVIRHQHRLLTKYLRDSFRYTVADNSLDPEANRQIRAYCQSQRVAYLRLPPYEASDGSDSHGQALNWLWHNYIRPRQPLAFSFLDHDVFPMRPTHILPLLRHCPVYGHLQERGTQWYLWPGFSFYDFAFCRNRPLDFKPCPPLDTGGGNWLPLYSHLEKASLTPILHGYRSLREGNDVQRDQVEFFSDWLHTINASGWKPSENKDFLVDDYVSRL